MNRLLFAGLCIVLLRPVTYGYVRSTDSTESHALIRLDGRGIQFYYNDQIVPGLKNRDGQLFITADSTPIGSLRQAMLSWQSITSASINFLPLKKTSAGLSMDRQHTIVFQDTDATRAATAGALAVTVASYTLDDYHIADSDIVFNPLTTFSTTGASGTIDMEAVLAHEMGHALGASHNNLLGATMFQSIAKNSAGSAAGVFPRTLSADDTAFASAVYPSSSATQGRLSGTVTIDGARPAKGALLTMYEVASGMSIGTLAGSDGRYSIIVPAGNYHVYAEPFNQLVQPGNLYLPANMVDENFRAAFFGGNSAPGTVNVPASGNAAADVQVISGTTSLTLDYFVTGGAGSAGDLQQLTSYNTALPLVSGQAYDVVLVGKGLDGGFLGSDSNLRVFGPGITVRPGSLRVDLSYVSQGFTLLRATVDVEPRTTASMASMFLASGTDTLAMSGSLVLLPGKPSFTALSVTNSGSFGTGPVSPGEIVSIFGKNLGPVIGFDSTLVGLDPTTNSFPVTLGGVKVTFDGIVAPLYYSRSDALNLQVPFEVAGKSTTRVIVSYNGVESDPVDIPVAGATPGIYTYNGSGSGPVIAVNQNGVLNSPTNPAPKGSYIVLYLTGRGAVTYPIQTGKPAPAPPVIDDGGFRGRIGGVPATVAFGGWTPTAVGLAQANILVPAEAGSGEQPISISIGSGASGPGTTIFVQ